MSDWIGLAVVLGAVAVTILVTVPWACRRCQCEEERRTGTTMRRVDESTSERMRQETR